MISLATTLRTSLAAVSLTAAAWGLLGGNAAAQQAPSPAGSAATAATAPAKLPGYDVPKDLAYLPPVPKNYKPKKTAWGEPDLRGTWPIDIIGGMPLQRTPAQGNRVWLTPEEYGQRYAQMQRSANAAAAEDKANKLGMGNWVEMKGAGARTSLLVDPPNGRLPEMTEYGKRMNAIGRSSWVRGQTFDWVTDFDSWDRCITRGFPASMLPFRYNNGIRIFQAPGMVVISLEMIHDDRIIYTDGRPAWPQGVKSYMGNSRAHWENGNTLVIETDHIRPGAAPLNMATIGSPPNNTVPMSDQAKVIERLTMTGPNSIVYEMTFSDPVIWTAPFTVRADWTRNDKYQFYEYACIEGDVQVRNYIVANRAQRAKEAAAKGAAPSTAAKPTKAASSK